MTAIEAASVYQRKAYERRNKIDIDQRLDPRVEIGDITNLDVIIRGTEREIERAIIVEDVRISMEDGDYNMSLSGRRSNVQSSS